MHPPLLLGLGFSNLPLLQMGIAAVSLPIIIHLLNRRKYRERSWAAMRFLLAAIRKNQRRIRVEQWLLLAVRTLLILCVVSAMAKPFLESLGALPLLPGQRTHRVIVIDGSLSMSYTPAETNRFDQAKALAAQLVRDARRGDALSVVLLADPPRIIVGEAAPSSNQSEILKEINQVNLPHGLADLTAGFEAIDRVLAVSTIPRKEVVILTDLQANTWRKPGAATADDGLKRAVAKLEARSAQSIVIDLGTTGGENRGISDFRINQPVVTVGQSELVASAVVHNYGSTSSTSCRVRLLIDGQLGPEQVVDIASGADATVNFRPTINTPGEHLLEVRLDDDPLPLDNHRWLALPVRDALSVLLVDGHFKSEPFASETDYLSQALNPGTNSPGVPALIKTRVLPESRFARQDLSTHDVVCLCNVAQFTESETAALDAFLKQGGGVVIFGGDQIVPENYNRLLYQDGKGLLPASIGAPMGDDKRKQGSFEFNPLGFQHPIVRQFFGTEAAVIAGLTNSKTWKYHKLVVPKDSAAKVALAFNTGDPAIVEAPRYRGRVILVATSADAGWSTWPLHPSYAPVMEQIILQAAAGRLAERNLRVGRPIDQVLPAASANTLASVTRPDGGKVQVKIKADDDVSRFHYEETDLSGAYKVQYVGTADAKDLTFAADPDPIESDLIKLDKSSLAAAIPGWKFSYMTNWKDLTGNAASIARIGELQRPLLLAVLALLLIESILAWRFSHHSA